MFACSPEHPVRTLRDALGLTLALADEFAYANAAFLIDAHGYPIDHHLDCSVGSPITNTLLWASTVSPTPAANSILLVSVRSELGFPASHTDVSAFLAANNRLVAAGLRLVDWVLTDGDEAVSLAYAVWPDRAWCQPNPPLSA